MDSVGCVTSVYTSTNPELYFRDGKRRTDYVLAYRFSASRCHDHNRRLLFLSELAKQKIEIEVEDSNGNLLGATVSSTEDDFSLLTLKTSFAHNVQASAPPLLDENFTPSMPIPSTDYRESDKPTDTSPPSSMDRYRQKALDDKIFLLAPDNLVFVKLHVSWEAMTYYAEYLKLRKRLRQLAYGWKFEESKSKPSAIKDFFKCLQLDENVIKPPDTCYTWPFSLNREYLFDIPENKDEFFTSVERALVLDHILRRTGYKSEDLVNADDLYEPSISDNVPSQEPEDEFTGSPNRVNSLYEIAAKNLGITKLISDGIFLAAYPLHEPSEKLSSITIQQRTLNPNCYGPSGNALQSTEFNNRILLQRYWASYKMLFKCQPISYIRHYFGEAVAFYFAWLGFYTAWLLPIAILGIIVFLFGLLDLKSDSIIHEVCDLGHSIFMCPLCKSSKCNFWTLDTSCFRTKLMRLVDHEGTVVFAVVMSLWAVIFFEMWKRRQVSLAYHWNVYSLEPMDQPPRPEFMALINKRCPRKVNPLTGYVEPFIPFWRRKLPVIFVSYSTVLLTVMLTLAFLVGVVLYKLVIKAILYRHHNPMIQSTAGMIATMTGSLLNLVVIFFLKIVYDRMATKLTDVENHRTQVEYDNSLTLKLYLLQFVNYYSSVFYIAFIQGPTSAVPGSEHILIQSTGCDQGDCLFELFIQLVIIMVGKQVLGFIQESLMPVLLKLFFKFRTKKRRHNYADRINTVNNSIADNNNNNNNNMNVDENKPYTTSLLPSKYSSLCQRNILCRSDFYLLDPGSRPLFNEYLEMMIQYGFITMFVPAFPLAPLFGLLNNLFEIRGDAKKLVNQYRRPVLERVQTIGIWLTITTVLASIAIRTNACIIAFTTQFIDRCVYRYSYSPDRSMKGFKNFTLSYMSTTRFDIPTNETYCRYDSYRSPPWSSEPYVFTSIYYHVLAAKFIFVFAFETIATILTNVIMAAVPDVPKSVKREIFHETNITNAIILSAEVGNQQYNKTLTKDVNFRKIVMLKSQYDKLQTNKNNDNEFIGNYNEGGSSNINDIPPQSIVYKYVSFENPSTLHLTQSMQCNMLNVHDDRPNIGFNISG
ncbi:Anoctamin-7 [Schistosoma japonicum]|nr:Anoctamin-7 [Schistosoma japonicum]